jgi:hypothetical protein
MKFDWDSKKESSNKRKHNISFSDAKEIFLDPFHLSISDDYHSQEEERWITIGSTINNKIIVVCHTYRFMENEEVIRIISARAATSREKRQYVKG